ncbi:MAG: hypothetical protein ACI4MT_04870, partial [Christensenellales bacterium]
MNASGKRTLIITIAVILVIVAIILSVTLTNKNEISFDGNSGSLVQAMKNGEVKSLTLSGSYKVIVSYVDSSKKNAYCYIDSRTKFLETYNEIYYPESGTAPTVQAELVYDNPSTSSMLYSMIVPAI